ncbi:MAG: DUF58 domain-containing protein [Pseudomonadota bacterium]|nr:DUF58 domain-containing protein [Pseudomonadota bacterium]
MTTLGAAGLQTQPQSWPARVRQRLWRLAPDDTERLVLRHSRIYILPTTRGAALIATLAIMLLTAMNYALSLGYALTFLTAGLVAAALLATFRNLAGLAVSPLGSGEAFAGGDLEFTLSLASGSRRRVGITVAGRQGLPGSVDLPSGATRPIGLSITAPTRGRVGLGRVSVSSDFPLGIWRAWAYVHFPLSGNVFPAPEAGAPPLPMGRHGSFVGRSSRLVDTELAGLREYERGDAQNRIAWKAVARGAGWYSKQFEGTGGGGTLELHWSELPQGLDTETRLSRFTAWILAAERAARAFSLHIPGTMLPTGQGAGHRRKALIALALFPPGPER